MKVLLIASRDPRGVPTGRKLVLNTTIRCLETLGYQVHVAYCGKSSAGSEPTAEVAGNAVYYRVPLPSVLELIRNGVRLPLDRDSTINEALYFSARGRQRCAELIDAIDPCFIVVDMLRCAQFVDPGAIPIVLDLDDLLSRRYAQVLGGGVRATTMLGYYGEGHPLLPILGRLVQPFLATLIKLESQRLQRKEIDAVARFSAVTLVSQREADILRDACDGSAKISAMPMAIGMTERIAPLSEQPARLVFVGSPSYWPNREALVHADRVLLPFARRHLGPELHLNVIGAATPSQRREFSDCLHFSGYVSDLDAALIQHDIFVAPIVSGSGIKTKVIEAMSRGLVVLGAPKAFDGLGVRHLEHVLVFDSPEAFVSNLRFLRSHATEARRIAANGRRYVAETFATEVVVERWRRMVDTITPLQQAQAG